MRVAILDLGTNTFHLFIANVGSDGEIKKVFKSKRVVKLLENSNQSNLIQEVSFQRGIAAIRGFKEIISVHTVDRVYAFATSAIRSATNGKDFVRAVFEVTGIQIKTISGNEEAKLIYYGVKQCVTLGDHRSLIMDIGGGSTEFIIANRKKIFWKHSFNIGAARLIANQQPSDPIKRVEVKKLNDFLETALEPLHDAIRKFPVNELIGSSGSFDTFAEMIGWKYHQKNVIGKVKAYEFNLDEFGKLYRHLVVSSASERMKMKGLVKMRVDMIVVAAICTNFILKKYKIRKMILSRYALKEGAMWKLANRFA